MEHTTPRTGMPPGIPYIVGNEAAERFSYYGMKAILTVFMTQYLMMGEGQAVTWVHTFGMAAYFLPIAGAFLADIIWGKYKTIIGLSLVYCLGHLLLFFIDSKTGLAMGLTLIAIGSGGIKPNVGSHVGDQFTRHNGHLLEKAFGYFYVSINVGAMVATVLIPWLLNAYGPHIAFGVPGLLMFLATLVFWLGRNKFVAIEPVGWERYRKEVFTKQTGMLLLKLSIIYFFFVSVFWSLFEQTMSTWVLQASRELMDKNFRFGSWSFEVLPSQMQSINSFFILILTPLFAFAVYPFLNKIFPLTPFRKIGLGLAVTSLSFLISGWLELQMEAGHTVHVAWQILAYFFITSGEVMVSITGLEFAYTQAPRAIKSLVMAMFYMSVSLGNGITIMVNEFTLVPVEVTSIKAGENGTYFTSILGKNGESHRIDLPEIKTLYQTETRNGQLDTVYFGGTYTYRVVDEITMQAELLDVDGNPVVYHQLPAHNVTLVDYKVMYNKLLGSQYYFFFVGLILVAALLFIPVAYWYKERNYVGDTDEASHAQ